MPDLDDLLEQQTATGSNFGFSGTRLDVLADGANEYTIVSLFVDGSGSVSGFKTKIENAVKEVIKSCSKSPRVDNLLIRLVVFNSTLTEIHGFKLFENINLADYDNFLNVGGCTLLYDGTINSRTAINDYARQLTAADFKVNSIEFVITDGEDVGSLFGVVKTRESLDKLVRDEQVESHLSILIGVNAADCSAYLKKYKDGAGFDQYVESSVSASDLAKLAKFVSQSISAQSSSLGTGNASQPLSF